MIFRRRVERATPVVDQQPQDGAGEGLRAGPDLMEVVDVRTLRDEIAVADDDDGLIGIPKSLEVGRRFLEFHRIHSLGLRRRLLPIRSGERVLRSGRRGAARGNDEGHRPTLQGAAHDRLLSGCLGTDSKRDRFLQETSDLSRPGPFVGFRPGHLGRREPDRVHASREFQDVNPQDLRPGLGKPDRHRGRRPSRVLHICRISTLDVVSIVRRRLHSALSSVDVNRTVNRKSRRCYSRCEQRAFRRFAPDRSAAPVVTSSPHPNRRGG